MAYLGNNLQVAFPSYRNIDDISGNFDGIETSFALTVDGVAPIPAPINSQQCLISVNGVVQRPDDSGTEGFRLSGGNIIFASAPAGGVDFFGVILAGADYVNVGADFPSGTASAPSITFDSDLDTGIYNPAGNEIGFTTGGTQRLVINSSGQISSGLGTAAAPAFSFISDPNTGLYSPGADQVAISTNGSGRLFVDASGNVAIGTSDTYAPLVVRENSTGGRIALTTGQNLASSVQGLYFYDREGSGGFPSSPGQLTSFITSNRSGTTGEFALRFGTANSLTVDASEKARIDSSGRLLVGTSSSSAQVTTLLQGNSGGSTSWGALNLARGTATPSSGQSLGELSFSDSGHDIAGLIACQRDGGTWTSGSSQPTRLVFSTTEDGAALPTERMRIENTGRTSLYSTTTGSAFQPAISAAAGTSSAILSGFHSATAIAVGTLSVRIWSNGNIVNTNNSYGSISDIKLKENIVNATSQWADIKALQIRKYNFKEETGQETHTQIGLIAQEVELVSPGLVSESPDRDEDGNDLGTVTKSVNYSVLYMKAVKALQEAMERIETLETEMAAIKAQLA